MATENTTTAEELQRQMQSVRASMRADVKELVENARDMTDWHYYVRRYPIATVAAAAAAGFALTSLGAPSPKATPSPSVPEAGPFMSNGRGSGSSTGSTSSFVQQLFGSASSMATSAISRAAMGILSQQLARFVDGQLRDLQADKPHQDYTHDQPHR
jgi:hypothetical protein